MEVAIDDQGVGRTSKDPLEEGLASSPGFVEFERDALVVFLESGTPELVALSKAKLPLPMKGLSELRLPLPEMAVVVSADVESGVLVKSVANAAVPALSTAVVVSDVSSLVDIENAETNDPATNTVELVVELTLVPFVPGKDVTIGVDIVAVRVAVVRAVDTWTRENVDRTAVTEEVTSSETSSTHPTS